MTATLARPTAALGAAACGLAVLLGAFGSHALPRYVPDPHLQQVWETAVRYQLAHGLALLFVSGVPEAPRWVTRCFVAGTAIFSGSLYLLALTGLTRLGMVTPIGGLLLLVGWGLLFVRLLRGGAGER